MLSKRLNPVKNYAFDGAWQHWNFPRKLACTTLCEVLRNRRPRKMPSLWLTNTWREKLLLQYFMR